MTEEQQIIRQAIKELRAIEAGRHVPKWRGYLLRELEILDCIAATKLLNPNHPHNQPIGDPES